VASFQKYQTKDGIKWLYKYYSVVDPLTGKKKQSTKRGFNTKKEAQLDAAKTEQEIASGTFITEDRSVTFNEVYKLWYETAEASYKPSTRKAVISKFNKRILPYFCNMKLKDINRLYCQDVINKLSQEIKSVSDIKMYMNQVFEFAITNELISSNPIKGIKIPKKSSDHLADEAEDDSFNFWEKSDIKTFLDYVQANCSMRDYLMFHLMIYTGARKGEILALTWDDVDFNTKTLQLNKTLFHANGEFMSLTSKTKASRRVISLDTTSINLLKKYSLELKKQQLQRVRPSEATTILSREDGTPLRLAYPNDKLAEVLRSLNIKPINVHGLRHTHASLLFEAGATIKEVQERLGHSDMNMTMNIYTHVTKAVKEKTADKFEKFMEL